MKLGRKALAIALAALIVLTHSPSARVYGQAAGTVDIVLTPPSLTANVGETFAVNVVLLPNSQPAASVDVVLNFDPTYLEVTQVAGAAGSPFHTELNNSFNNVAGHADYSAGTLSTPPSAGEVAFATVTFRAKAPTLDTAVTFDLVSTLHTDVGFDGQSVLGNATGATVTVTGTQPAAAFNADVTIGAQPLTVNFTDTSTGSPTAWLWYFGDGSTSSQRNPTHVYNNAGVYAVTLIVTVSGGQPSLTRNGYISVLAPTPTPASTPTPTQTPAATATPATTPAATPATTPAATPATTPTATPATTPTATATTTPAAGVTSTPTPASTPAPTPAGSPTPTPPPTGGSDFTGLLPWLAAAGLVVLSVGVVVRRRRKEA